MGKVSRQRGKQGEREVVQLYNALFDELGIDDLKARRILTESREGSFDVEVVRVNPHELPAVVPVSALPWAIQVKNVSANHGAYLLNAWREAKAGGGGSCRAIGCTKTSPIKTLKKRTTWVASVELAYLILLQAKAHMYDILHGEMGEEEHDTDSS